MRSSPPSLRRRALIGIGASLAARVAGTRAAGLPTVRLGVLQFGTVQWVADVVRRHALDTAHGFALATFALANTDADRVAIMAGQADVVVSDWMFVAVQRAAGTKLCFAPFSASTGGVMTRADSPIHTLADLKGRRLGVAGGPVDKSWLVVRAAARKQDNIDLANDAQVVYGAPPLLGAKLEQGELDAVLTFWPFAARLEADGYRQAVSVSDCAVALGLPAHLNLVGFVFREDWASAENSPVDGFLAAAAEAERTLIGSDDEWRVIRPLMNAPGDALFARLRQRFADGIAHPDAPTQQREAEALFAILKETGGAQAAGGLDSLPQGMFWRTRHESG
ncbi:MAG TPA: ABC transporter substrate-binding protein [Acidisphaera sp.]|nr:ABC transporter substrate-binding protein [Acidisphaera sp.]